MVVDYEDGSKRTVLKSSVVWILNETKEVLSNDRLKRVQQKVQKRSNVKADYTRFKRRKITEAVQLCDEMKIGDWCLFFHNIPDSAQTPANKFQIDNNPNILFGSILGFKYIQGKNEKEKQYTKDYVQIKISNEDDVEANIDFGSDNGINVNATWFTSEHQTLVPFSVNNSFHISLKNYIATIDTPISDINTHANTFQTSYKLADDSDKLKAKLISLYS